MANYDLAIIGGGVAGFAGAMYAARLGLKTVVFSESTGGTLILTDTVENYPGFASITGMELARKIREHALGYDGVTLVEEKVDSVRKTRTGSFSLSYRVTGCVEAKAVLVATGTKWRKLGVPGEDGYQNRGVHYCALCDGYFYKGKSVAVVGGGDSAAKEALHLAELAKSVTILVRGSELKAEPINMARLAKFKNVSVVTGTTVLEIRGDGKSVTGVVTAQKAGRKIIAVDGLFIEIGHLPLSELAKSLGCKLNARNEIIIDRECKTSVPGVFAAGDVADTPFKQAITGVGEAVTAAYGVFKYLNEHDIHPSGECSIKGKSFDGMPALAAPHKLNR